MLKNCKFHSKKSITLIFIKKIYNDYCFNYISYIYIIIFFLKKKIVIFPETLICMLKL